MILRPYQREAVARVLPLLRAGRRVCLVLPTGAGKTVVAAEVVRQFQGKTLWLAHRRELIAQAKAALPPETVVDSVQRRKPFATSDLIVVDEGHHSVAGSYLEHLSEHRGAALHLTATPYRLDGKGIGKVADVALWVDWPQDGVPQVREGRKGYLTMTKSLVREGVLLEPSYYSIPGVDLEGIKKSRGDYETSGLIAAADKPSILGDAIREYRKHATGRRAVAFCVTVRHAEHVAAAFNEAGIPSAVVSGVTPKHERDSILGRLRSGEIHVVATVMVLTEGWDLPSLECLIVLRPTSSLCLWLQMLGRVMRTSDGKPGAVVLDHSGNTQRLGFATDDVEFDLDGVVKKPGLAPTTTCKHCYAIFPLGCLVCPECGEPTRDDSAQGKDPVKNGLGDDTVLVELKPGEVPPEVFAPKRWAAILESADSMEDARRAYAREFKCWPIVSHDGRLLDPSTIEARKREYFRLLLVAVEKGHALGSAYYRFKDRFGIGPGSDWTNKFREWAKARGLTIKEKSVG